MNDNTPRALERFAPMIEIRGRIRSDEERGKMSEVWRVLSHRGRQGFVA
jgi:hypothetical protein